MYLGICHFTVMSEGPKIWGDGTWNRPLGGKSSIYFWCYQTLRNKGGGVNWPSGIRSPGRLLVTRSPGPPVVPGPPVHRDAICQFLFRWIYYCHSSKSTGKEIGKTHLCALVTWHVSYKITTLTDTCYCLLSSNPIMNFTFFINFTFSL